MVKKTNPMTFAPSKWNPESKEAWHLEFEKESVNDDKWTCVVTAAIQSQPEDEECINIFAQSVATGSRRAIKIITMADVTEMLRKKQVTDNRSKRKEKGGGKKPQKANENESQATKGEKVGVEKVGAKGLRPPQPRTSPLEELAAEHAVYNEFGCELPPDLMAGLLKHLILNLKEESVFRKRVEAARERKLRRRTVRADFIRSMKPFEISNEAKESRAKSGRRNRSDSEKPEMVNDEPYPGPDLYVVLVDFYDPFYFTELLRINVPFVAIFKISNFKDVTSVNFSQLTFTNPDEFSRKEFLVSNFWKVTMENCQTLDKTIRFKDILLMEYQPQFAKTVESKQIVRDVIFDEISWMLYTTFVLYRQHQTYLRETFVQRMIISLQPLDLTRCNLYNKLCDALVTGEPNTVFLVLYAMIEQVVAGVPPTDWEPLEYEPIPGEYFSKNRSRLVLPGDGQNAEHPAKSQPVVVTPCHECRDKVTVPMKCPPRRQPSYDSDDTLLDSNERAETSKSMKNYPTDDAENEFESVEIQSESTMQLMSTDESSIDESLIEQCENERKMKTDGKNRKIWKSPMLCFYGDEIALQNYHVDPRLIDSESVFFRFFKKTEVPQLWLKYPEPCPEKKAFYNFHFSRFAQKSDEEDRDTLKIKIFFSLTMTLVGITNCYMYRGEEENISELFRATSREKAKKLSKVKFDPHGDALIRCNKSFSSFFTVFVPNVTTRKKVTVKAENFDKPRGSFVKGESTTIRKATSVFNMSFMTHRNSGYWFLYSLKGNDSGNVTSFLPTCTQIEKEFATLYSLLDCYEISNLSDPQMLRGEDDFVNLIKSFNFFEMLEPRRMLQRLLEAQENFNTTQCYYFAPTDTLIAILHNDCDYRGVFFTSGYGTLLTPVGLRDFYGHVHAEIGDWLNDEKETYAKFVAQVEEKAKCQEEKEKMNYFDKLKTKYEGMNETERKQFLDSESTDQQQNNEQEIEIAEDELEDLPDKPKPEPPNKISFVATNFVQVRVETKRKVQEFYSKDGTEVSVVTDSWLYEPEHLLTLSIKQSDLKLLYHQWLGREPETTFALKTSSDVNFVFYKEEDFDSGQSHFRHVPDSRYRVKVSWPTGLSMEGIFAGKSKMYVRQSYIDVYKKWWELEGEKCRCFLRNGQVLIFRDSGEVEIWCASGTKHILKEFAKVPEDVTAERQIDDVSPSAVAHYQTVTATGEIWEKAKACSKKKKMKLVKTLKIYVGVDPNTLETYYRREDGVSCMLWPNGKLVTTFPDGTKITSTPDFDPEEIAVDWTEKERIHMLQILSKHREENAEIQPKSKTILKKLSTGSSTNTTKSSLDDKSDLQKDGFVSVSLSYLMEHPKYSTVHHSSNPFVQVKMANELSIKMYPRGNYLVNQNRTFLSVQTDSVEFYRICPGCSDTTKSTLYIDSSSDLLCQCTDFSHATFEVSRKGETTYLDPGECGDGDGGPNTSAQGINKTCSFWNREEHVKGLSHNQRCFALERDLSGIEFIHNDRIAHYCYTLPPDTYYELHSINEIDSLVSHLFSNSCYKIGHEKWLMPYEDENNSLPTNLKKKDLVEMGARSNQRKLFRYPLARSQKDDCDAREDQSRQQPEMPKAVVTRIVKCLSDNPKTVIDDVKECIARYQKKAHRIYVEYKKFKSFDQGSTDDKRVKMKLKKIGLALNRKWDAYAHTSIQVPSTETDIHYFGHYVNLMDELKMPERCFLDVNEHYCKQIPLPLPRISNFTSIYEENESQADEVPNSEA